MPIDEQLNDTMWEAGISFVGRAVRSGLLCVVIYRPQAGKPTEEFSGGARVMVIGAFLLVGTEILALGVLGQKAWASVYFTPPKPDAMQIQAQAEQFAFFFRYPGPDGKFGALHPDKIDEGNQNYFGLDPANDVDARDDIVSGELVVPVNREIQLLMHAKDVGHSFYVRELRIQQDFVPGLDLVRAFHGDENRQIRNRVHATVRSGPLQHEGVSERDVRAGLREVAERAGGSAVGARFPHGARNNSRTERSFRSEVIQMEEASVQQAHVHAPPEGFPPEVCVQPGPQSHREAVLRSWRWWPCSLGMVLSWLMRIHMVWPNAKIPLLGASVERGRAGRGDDSRILSVTDDHARDVDGVFCANQCALRGIRQLFSANSDWGGRHGVSAVQHDVLLDHVCCVCGSDAGVLYSGWTAHRRVDQLRSIECSW